MIWKCGYSLYYSSLPMFDSSHYNWSYFLYVAYTLNLLWEGKVIFSLSFLYQCFFILINSENANFFQSVLVLRRVNYLSEYKIYIYRERVCVCICVCINYFLFYLLMWTIFSECSSPGKSVCHKCLKAKDEKYRCT